MVAVATSGQAGLGPGGAGPSTRDGFYDVVRAAALLRVVLWHTVAAAWISWAFAAMPLMFFTAGVMLERSATTSTPLALLRRRARRLMLPMWALGAVVGAAAVLHVVATAQPLRWVAALVGVLRWILPLSDPPAPAWQHGWLVSHLWYLRAYLWMVVCSPALLIAARRLRWSVPAFVAGIVGVEAARRTGTPVVGTGWVRLALGDATCYGLFAVLGMAWSHQRRTGRSMPATGRLVVAGAVLTAGAVLWAWLGGLPTGVANDSYPVLALLGAGWLAVVLAGRGPLGALASAPLLGPVVRTLNRRAVTIYLWHPLAIVAALSLVGGSSLSAHAARLLLTAAGTATAVIAFGWVEDLAAGRPARRLFAGAARRPSVSSWTSVAALSPQASAVPLTSTVVPWVVPPATIGAARTERRPRPVLSFALAFVVAVVALPGALSDRPAAQPGFAVPPPSDRAALGDDRFADERAPVAAGQLTLDEPALQAALARWAAAHPEVGEVTVAVELRGALAAASATGSGRPGQPADRTFETLSLTKMFTATVVLQLADEGRIALDEPLPPVSGVVPPSVVPTPRMLLQHTSGLENYPDVATYRPDVSYLPADAVSLATTAPLRAEPGTAVWYSNANYLWLGLLAEQVSGRSFAELVDERIAVPLGLSGTSVEELTRPGWVGFSSGSVVSTGPDLARFAAALFRGGRLLPAARAAEMANVDDLNVGLGAWPLCPCASVGEHKLYTAVGHTNAYGGLYYFPLDDLALFVQVDTVPLDVHETYDEVADALVDALRVH